MSHSNKRKRSESIGESPSASRGESPSASRVESPSASSASVESPSASVESQPVSSTEDKGGQVSELEKEPQYSLTELQSLYRGFNHGKLPRRFMNNKEWLLKKITYFMENIEWVFDHREQEKQKHLEEQRGKKTMSSLKRLKCEMNDDPYNESHKLAYEAGLECNENGIYTAIQ